MTCPTTAEMLDRRARAARQKTRAIEAQKRRK